MYYCAGTANSHILAVSNTVTAKELEVSIDSKHICLAVVPTGNGYIRWL